MTDVVRLGATLKELNPAQPDPRAGVGRLVVESGLSDSLRIDSGNGFGPIGEHLDFVFDAAGVVERVRRGGGTLLPIARAVVLNHVAS